MVYLSKNTLQGLQIGRPFILYFLEFVAVIHALCPVAYLNSQKFDIRGMADYRGKK